MIDVLQYTLSFGDGAGCASCTSSHFSGVGGGGGVGVGGGGGGWLSKTRSIWKLPFGKYLHSD